MTKWALGDGNLLHSQLIPVRFVSPSSLAGKLFALRGPPEGQPGEGWWVSMGIVSVDAYPGGLYDPVFCVVLALFRVYFLKTCERITVCARATVNRALFAKMRNVLRMHRITSLKKHKTASTWSAFRMSTLR